MNRHSHARPLQVAIDGLVATGKSTVGAAVAKRLGILYLDTGVMYRAVALLALEGRIELSSEDDCAQVAETMNLRLYPSDRADNGQNIVCIGERDITQAIRSDEVNHAVPVVSAHLQVRSILIQRQQVIADRQPVVMVGRDIASVVLPHAQLKVRLTAPLDVRVRRRADELMRTQPHVEVDTAHLRREIQRRDEMDDIHMSRAPDITIVQTDNLTVDEVAEAIIKLVPITVAQRSQIP